MQEDRPGEEFQDGYGMSETVPSVSEPHSPDPRSTADDYGTSETVPYVPYETSSSPQVPDTEPVGVAGDGEREKLFIPSGSEPKKSHRRGWIIAGSAALLVVILASVASFFIINYINRPTPNKTLDIFCGALQREDYRTAYNQFSPGMQSTIAEADFAALLSQDRVTLCTHGNTDDSKNSVTTSLKLVHASKGVNSDLVTLTKDKDNNWKISDIGRQ